MLTFEDYSISLARTGDARITQLVLTGWSDATGYGKFEQGRGYWKVTTGNVLEIYKTEAKASGTKICSGSIDGTTDIVTLTADNTSGITGSAVVIHTLATEATGEVIVTYAHETDLAAAGASITSLLDGSSQWEGGVRFELALKEGKRMLDDWLRGSQRHLLRRNTGTNELLLADIAKPKALARAHAQATLYILFKNLAVTRGPDFLDQATFARKDAVEALKAAAPELDFLNDDIVDAIASTSVVRLTREGW